MPPSLPSNHAVLARLVDDRLGEIILGEPQVPNLHDGLLYAMGLDLPAGEERGKRIRPVLCLATAEALGAPAGRALGFACAIELMHHFALVHDDIEDGDTVRRNRPCTYLRYGTAHGINIGDYLLCKVFSTLLGDRSVDDATRLRLVELMSETLDHTHIGQSLDISARANRVFAMADYERIVAEKTGHYLAAPMLGGAIVAGAGAGVMAALGELGGHLGPLFQIVDDVIDLTEGKGRGGERGNDIREGKRSFLVAAAAEVAGPGEKDYLFNVLDTPRAETTAGDVDRVIALFDRLAVLARARERCDTLRGLALGSLAPLPTRLRETLAGFVVELSERRK